MSERLDERVWNDRWLETGETIELDGMTATRLPPSCQTLLTGNFQPLLGKTVVIGLGEECGRGKYALRIGYDCVLLITPKPPKLKNGWHVSGCSLTRADGKYAVIELAGVRCEEFLAQGTETALQHGSPSACVQFAHLNVLLVRKAGKWLLFVETPFVAHITNWLRGFQQGGSAFGRGA